jgi:hypothetical protein
MAMMPVAMPMSDGSTPPISAHMRYLGSGDGPSILPDMGG